MADETPASLPVTPPESKPTKPGHEALRWTIRIAGLALMIAGTVYLALTAGSMIFAKGKPLELTYALVVSLLVLGIGIFLLRTGLRMFWIVDLTSIRQFSFFFAVIFTLVVLQIMPLANMLGEHAGYTGLLVVLYFGLTYWVLQRILASLLLSPEQR